MSGFDLSGRGKVALITGGASGLGRSVAEVFAAAGYRLVLLDSDAAAGKSAAAELTSAGHEARFVAADVADGEQVEGAIRTALEQWQRLDFVLNNAGVSGRMAGIEKLDETDFERVMAVNLKGPFLVCKHAVRAQRRAGGGSIVNIGSITGSTGAAGFAPYAASKAGLVALTRSMARRVGRYNIRVNCLRAGSIAGTGLMDGVYRQLELTPEQRLRQTYGMMRSIPLARLASPRDIAHFALFLASPLAAHIHGAVLTIDGGESLKYQ